MSDTQIYRARDSNFATYTEIVENDPVLGDTQSVMVDVESDGSVQWILAVVSTPEGHVPSYLDADIEVRDKNGKVLDRYAYSVADSFIASPPRIILLSKPQDRDWSIKINSGTIPFSVSVLVYHPTFAINFASPPPFKCRICISTSKALAVAIVAAVALPAIPAAVLAATASSALAPQIASRRSLSE